jgi:hypothetical protein
VSVARREGFEPPTARSVVSHHPSPPVLPIPSHPRWSWSTAIMLIRFGYPSLPVACGMVAMWSQFRAIVARLGVWQHVALLTALRLSTRFWIWCSTSPQWSGPGSLHGCSTARSAVTEASGRFPGTTPSRVFLPTFITLKVSPLHLDSRCDLSAARGAESCLRPQPLLPNHRIQ